MLKKLPQAVPLETSSRINEDIQMFYIESTLDSLAGPSGNEQLTSPVCEAETCSHDPPMLSETTQPPKHIRRPTQKARQALEDTLPEGPGPLEGDTGQPMEDTSLEPEAISPLTLRIPRIIRTIPNSFGLSRIYRGRPTHVPDMDIPLEQLAADGLDVSHQSERPRRSLLDIIWPYPNLSSWKLNNWFWNDGAKKSKASRQSLLEDVILSDGFDADDLWGVNFDQFDQTLATSKDPDAHWNESGWINSTLTIEIPTGIKSTKAVKRQRANAAQAAKRHDEVDLEAPAFETRKFDVPDFYHRSLIHVLKEVVEKDEAARGFHWHPFEQVWQPPNPKAPVEHVHGELYSSPEFLEADRELQASPPEPNCDLPHVIAGFMFASDATHVAQFGQAKLWPGYAGFANQTKYDRCKPSTRAFRQVAYFQSVSF
jgi:hypothetical protein